MNLDLGVDYRNLSLTEVITQFGEISSEAERQFGELNGLQLNWKPNAETWSVAQCLEHLIVTNKQFYPTLDALAEGRHRPNFWQRLPLLPNLFGTIMVKSLMPPIKRKFKAPPIASPSMSEIDSRMIERFKDHQTDLAARFSAITDRTPESVIVSSPFVKAIMYSVLDAGRIAVTHEWRHLAQATGVMGLREFPG